jgi:hypothetical protein
MGPPSLHTPVPFRGSELLSRRTLIEQGLYIMSTRGLVDANVDEKGIEYFPGPAALSLVGSLGSKYFLALEERCKWAARTFTSRSTPELMADFAQRGHLWGAELEAAVMLRSA